MASIGLIVLKDTLPDGVPRLAEAAKQENYEHIQRLVSEWADGRNHFMRRGERLIAAFAATEIVAVGGVTVEFSRDDWLRMRRFYVLPSCRGRGIGRMVAGDLLAHAKAFADVVTVHAGGTEAALFWEAMGFRSLQQDSYTHIYRFA